MTVLLILLASYVLLYITWPPTKASHNLPGPQRRLGDVADDAALERMGATSLNTVLGGLPKTALPGLNCPVS